MSVHPDLQYFDMSEWCVCERVGKVSAGVRGLGGRLLLYHETNVSRSISLWKQNSQR